MTTTINCASFHSLSRTKERAGLSMKAAGKHISRALKNGKSADEFPSQERSFLENKTNKDCTAIAYAGFCYIVNPSGLCITMYPLPAWFGKKKHFDGKEKIRNIKSYMRNHKESYYDRTF